MRRLPLVILGLLVVGAMAHMGCMDRQPAPVCPVPTELNETEAKIGGFEGVDMLVVIDDSSSMQQEQEILATAFFPLVNSLVNPLPTWPYAAADDVRVAVVTSNMGLSWGGNPYQDGDGWPTTIPDSCSQPLGDNGQFQSIDVNTVNIAHNEIPCDSTAAQCPTGWTCNVTAEGEEGTCQAPGGDGSNQTCPSLNSPWAETLEAAPNPNLAFQVACLAQQGITGCGFEQQLQSAARALTRDDQAAFIRDKSLLVVLIVSDESDCSMKSNDLFDEPEIQDSSNGSKLNIACGKHPEHLYTPGDYYTAFTNAKGSSNSVIFAAIVGVPKVDDCQGKGNTIGNCLEHPDMQLNEYQDSSNNWYFEDACTNGTVTEAKPGRRYVQLANENFGPMGYVYSICNSDWSPAMEEIARLIAENLKGTCYENPLDWDPNERVAKCDVLVEYLDVDECPSKYDDDEPIIEEYVDADEVEHTRVLCRMPKIPAPKDCAELDMEEVNTGFGWFYCENLGREDFTEVCEPGEGVDNDGDGDVDCADSDCADCKICGGLTDCSGMCKYMVQLTNNAEEEVQQRSISVQCIQQFSFEDPNCQENSTDSCGDDIDNDGNGVWDCEDVTDGETPHFADANCCPMDVEVDGNQKRCVLSSATNSKETAQDICGNEFSYSGSDYPGACVAAAARLGCDLP